MKSFFGAVGVIVVAYYAGKAGDADVTPKINYDPPGGYCNEKQSETGYDPCGTIDVPELNGTPTIPPTTVAPMPVQSNYCLANPGIVNCGIHKI